MDRVVAGLAPALSLTSAAPKVPSFVIADAANLISDLRIKGVLLKRLDGARVAVWNSFKIVLMLGLGLPERTSRGNLGDNFSRPWA